eukprot:TRINITY_DN69269_c0_g1_i1.p1 TRINITY_DN69269_c0_g1~~TRINITY_DN69269_c0_g1_i1.p1  ORF type:complete len:499 (+),score=38.08 TRINITY_DN69269_c0_g1_i1:41-1537(+)
METLQSCTECLTNYSPWIKTRKVINNHADYNALISPLKEKIDINEKAAKDLPELLPSDRQHCSEFLKKFGIQLVRWNQTDKILDCTLFPGWSPPHVHPQKVGDFTLKLKCGTDGHIIDTLPPPANFPPPIPDPTDQSLLDASRNFDQPTFLTTDEPFHLWPSHDHNTIPNKAMRSTLWSELSPSVHALWWRQDKVLLYLESCDHAVVVPASITGLPVEVVPGRLEITHESVIKQVPLGPGALYSTLHPGIRLESASGLVLTGGCFVETDNDKAYQVITAHDITQSEEIFHPKPGVGAVHVGKVVSVDHNADIALIEVDSALQYDNVLGGTEITSISTDTLPNGNEQVIVHGFQRDVNVSNLEFALLNNGTEFQVRLVASLDVEKHSADECKGLSGACWMSGSTLLGIHCGALKQDPSLVTAISGSELVESWNIKLAKPTTDRDHSTTTHETKNREETQQGDNSSRPVPEVLDTKSRHSKSKGRSYEGTAKASKKQKSE